MNPSLSQKRNFSRPGSERFGNNDISVAGQGFQVTNPAAVARVTVLTSNFDAEFRRAGGAVINTITKSGNNDYHGSVSAFLDSTRVDVLTLSQSRNPVLVQRGHMLPGTQQIYSGTLGRPLHLPRFGEGGPSYVNGRNRTFYEATELDQDT